MKELLAWILIIVASWLILAKVTHYDERMAEYNRHMCVDIYGKDENCK